MRRFWWLFGIVFVATLAVYVVGTGWISRTTIVSNVRHARRQLEAEKVVRDLTACGEALGVHRDRVLALGIIFKEPDFSRAYAVGSQLGGARQHFMALRASGEMEAAPTPQFMSGIQQLKNYRVPSISVMAPGPERILGIVVVVLGIVTVLLLGVRFLSNE